MTTPTPGRFRKNPIEIDATQWDGTAEGATPILEWILAEGGSARYDCSSFDCVASPDWPVHWISIDTLEGTMRCSKGDWIIRGVQGEFYPCKPDVFAETYSPVAVGTIESGLISATSTDEAQQPITAWVPTTDSDDDRLTTNGLLVDSRKPGYVDIALLNTHDDAWGDHWLVYEAPVETAVRVADAIRQKATETAALAEQPTQMPAADQSCTTCHGTGYVGVGEGRDYCRCTDGPDCIDCGAPDGGQHDRTCKHGADQ